MNSAISVFEKHLGLDQWPDEIKHLKGKTLKRKKDGFFYLIKMPSGQSFGGKPAAYLEPVGCSMFSRSHWKTHEKILKEMVEA